MKRWENANKKCTIWQHLHFGNGLVSSLSAVNEHDTTPPSFLPQIDLTRRLTSKSIDRSRKTWVTLIIIFLESISLWRQKGNFRDGAKRTLFRLKWCSTYRILWQPKLSLSHNAIVTVTGEVMAKTVRRARMLRSFMVISIGARHRSCADSVGSYMRCEWAADLREFVTWFIDKWEDEEF